jgi:hypothetical protein
MAVVPQAAAKVEPKAKFKLLSLSGGQTLGFHEEGESLTSPTMTARCVGTSTSRVDFRSTKRVTLYVFTGKTGQGPLTIVSPDPDRHHAFEPVPLVGEATVSRSVNYPETAGCSETPTNCPETTAAADATLVGTHEADGSLALIEPIDVHLPGGVDPGCGEHGTPYTGGGGTALGLCNCVSYVSAEAIPKRQLLDPKRKRVRANVTDETPLAGRFDSGDTHVTASGTLTSRLAVVLKRLPLKH